MASDALKRFYASADGVMHNTLEFLSPGFTEGPIRVVRGYEDITVTLEDGTKATFEASGIEIALPKNDNSGSQSLQFGLDNVFGEVQARIDQADKAGYPIAVIYRGYLDSDLNEPAKIISGMKVRNASMEGPLVNVKAGYQNLITYGWPRLVYIVKKFPGLTYIS